MFCLTESFFHSATMSIRVSFTKVSIYDNLLSSLSINGQQTWHFKSVARLDNIITRVFFCSSDMNNVLNKRLKKHGNSVTTTTTLDYLVTQQREKQPHIQPIKKRHAKFEQHVAG